MACFVCGSGIFKQKIRNIQEANFYKQDISGSAASGPEENKKPEATNITGPVILEAVRQMNPDERRELVRLLFA